MPPAVTYLAKSSDLGTQNSQPGEIVLEATALLYAHTTPLSAQITVWYLHKDLCNSPPDWLACHREDPDHLNKLWHFRYPKTSPILAS